MRPIIIEYLRQKGIDIYIPDYTDMYILMITAAITVSTLIALKKGLPAFKFFIATSAVAIFGFIGGKLLYFIRMHDVISFKIFVHSFSTLASESVGVYVFGTIGGILALKLLKLELLRSLDIYAISIALSVFIGRIGCFLNGCCYGKPSTLPWALPKLTNYREGLTVTSINLTSLYGMNVVRVHPTQLYESFFGLIMFIVLIRLDKRNKIRGLNFFLYITAYAVFRFLNEFLRGDDRGSVWIFSIPQLFSIIVFLAGALGIVMLIRTQPVYAEENNTKTKAVNLKYYRVNALNRLKGIKRVKQEE